jgi:hypothetical protein
MRRSPAFTWRPTLRPWSFPSRRRALASPRPRCRRPDGAASKPSSSAIGGRSRTCARRSGSAVPSATTGEYPPRRIFCLGLPCWSRWRSGRCSPWWSSARKAPCPRSRKLVRSRLAPRWWPPTCRPQTPPPRRAPRRGRRSISTSDDAARHDARAAQRQSSSASAPASGLNPAASSAGRTLPASPTSTTTLRSGVKAVALSTTSFGPIGESTLG